MMMMMMMMNCFCGMVDRWKAFSLISSQDYCQRSSPSWISNKPQAGFEPAQHLSSGLVEWSCAVVITTSSPVLKFSSFKFSNVFVPAETDIFRLLLGKILAWTPENGLFQKISKQGRGLRTWNFQRYWRKNIWKFQGSIKKEVEFPGVYKKKSCNFYGSLILTLEFPRGVAQFCKISRSESLFFFLELLWVK